MENYTNQAISYKNTNFFNQLNSNFSLNLLNDYENLLIYSKQSLQTVSLINCKYPYIR